jgi:hypothetical protein
LKPQTQKKVQEKRVKESSKKMSKLSKIQKTSKKDDNREKEVLEKRKYKNKLGVTKFRFDLSS